MAHSRNSSHQTKSNKKATKSQRGQTTLKQEDKKQNGNGPSGMVGDETDVLDIGSYQDDTDDQGVDFYRNFKPISKISKAIDLLPDPSKESNQSIKKDPHDRKPKTKVLPRKLPKITKAPKVGLTKPKQVDKNSGEDGENDSKAQKNRTSFNAFVADIPNQLTSSWERQYLPISKISMPTEWGAKMRPYLTDSKDMPGMPRPYEYDDNSQWLNEPSGTSVTDESLDEKIKEFKTYKEMAQEKTAGKRKTSSSRQPSSRGHKKTKRKTRTMTKNTQKKQRNTTHIATKKVEGDKHHRPRVVARVVARTKGSTADGKKSKKSKDQKVKLKDLSTQTRTTKTKTRKTQTGTKNKQRNTARATRRNKRSRR